MDLYLLRHGLAAEADRNLYPDDRIRPLTSRGQERLRLQAHAMKRLGMSFATILYSPLLRTRQTAEIIAREMDRRSALRSEDQLAPAGDNRVLIEIVRTELPRSQSVLLVGHEPNLGQLCSMLICGRIDARIRFKKGGLAHLESDESLAFGRTILRSLLAPAQLLQIV